MTAMHGQALQLQLDQQKWAACIMYTHRHLIDNIIAAFGGHCVSNSLVNLISLLRILDTSLELCQTLSSHHKLSSTDLLNKSGGTRIRCH